MPENQDRPSDDAPDRWSRLTDELEQMTRTANARRENWLREKSQNALHVRRITKLEARIAELEAALNELLPAEHGNHGGPPVGADVYYEDGDKDGISATAFAKARAARAKGAS